MSFRLCSQISLGKYAFKAGVNHVKIHRSVKEIVDTATIKIPAVGRVNNVYSAISQAASILGFNLPRGKTGNLPESSIETSTMWTEGDKVTIQLGYNGDYRQEFKGFVRRVKPSIPVEIECEGYAWQLRRKAVNGAWKSIKLKEFLKILIDGTDISLSPYIPDLTLTNISLAKNPNGLTALEYLHQHCHLAVYFQFDVLYVGIEEAIPGDTVKYRMGWNVPRTNTMNYRVADDTKVMVRLVAAKGKNAKRPVVERGDAGGSIITENISNIADPGNLNDIADQLYTYASFTGMEGYLDTFLQPYCKPCDTAQLIDKEYNVVTGSYFVEGVEVTFGMDGARRKVHLGPALGTPNFIGLQEKYSNY
ncbi:MAG: hypothetical protein JST19_13735 [Bacteroidetes bacterium]|nr:hypothetical protein [Bacteroidota bacterium]